MLLFSLVIEGVVGQSWFNHHERDEELWLYLDLLSQTSYYKPMMVLCELRILTITFCMVLLFVLGIAMISAIIFEAGVAKLELQ